MGFGGNSRQASHRLTGGELTPSAEAGSPQRMRYAEKQDRRGYLRKEGKTLRMKTKRYLALQGKRLSHHKDENSPPTWEIDVSTIIASVGPRQHELVLTHDDKSVSFFCANGEDLYQWVRCLKAARGKIEDWYEIGKEIGRGSYGTVYMGRDRLTQEKVAIKVIKKNPQSKRQTKFLEREVKILRSVDHPHVIVTYDVFEDDHQVALVSEYMEGGELFDRIIQDKAFTEQKAKDVARQILLGVEHLHSLQIVHRDVKPENVLCLSLSESKIHVKLTDFGLSNVMDEAQDASTALLSHVGTSFYLAPEVVGREGYGPGVDVWACGVVLYIMLCGRFPFWGKSDIEYLASLRRGPDMLGDEWSSVSEQGKQFVRSLLGLDPSRRPSASEALASEWMRETPVVDEQGSFLRLESQAGIAAVQQKHHDKTRQNAGAYVEAPLEPVTPNTVPPEFFEDD